MRFRKNRINVINKPKSLTDHEAEHYFTPAIFSRLHHSGILELDLWYERGLIRNPNVLIPNTNCSCQPIGEKNV